MSNESVKYIIEGSRGNWRAGFKIGVQSFFVCNERTKAEAQWYIKMLKKAFKTYDTNKANQVI